jgi:hypothetical protein
MLKQNFTNESKCNKGKMEKIPLKYLFTRYTTAFFIIKLESSGNKLDCEKITPVAYTKFTSTIMKISFLYILKSALLQFTNQKNGSHFRQKHLKP